MTTNHNPHGCCTRCTVTVPHTPSYHGDMVDEFLTERCGVNGAAGHRVNCGACLDCGKRA
jgi:hypothetical protein